MAVLKVQQKVKATLRGWLCKNECFERLVPSASKQAQQIDENHNKIEV